MLLQESNIREQVKQIKERVGDHYSQLSQIYDALENLMDEKVAQKKRCEREKGLGLISKIKFQEIFYECG